MYVFKNHGYFETVLYVSYVQFLMVCCDNNVLKVWFGLGITNTLLGLGKEHVLAYLGVSPQTQLDIVATSYLVLCWKPCFWLKWFQRVVSPLAAVSPGSRLAEVLHH